MPKISTESKEKIKNLSKDELEKIVLHFAAKEKSVYDYLMIHYLDEKTDVDLFQEAKDEIDFLFRKGYRGFSPQLQLANMISACIKRIKEFTKTCKDKKLEIDILMYVLDEVFSYSPNLFGTCFTSFDYKAGLLVKRMLTLLSKIHPDYIIEYREKINKCLSILHQSSSHIDFIYSMPRSI